MKFITVKDYDRCRHISIKLWNLDNKRNTVISEYKIFMGGIIMDNSAIIKEFIQSDIIKVPSSDVLNSKDNLIESGIIDSIGIQLLIAFLENKFFIEIADYEVVPDNFESVDAITMFVQNKKA